MGKKNAFLAKLEAQAAAKQAVKTEAHVEIDTIAMLLTVNERLQVGPGRADGVINDFLAWKLEIAEAIVKELDEVESYNDYLKDISDIPLGRVLGMVRKSAEA